MDRDLYIKRGCELLEINEKELNYFEREDVFNNDHLIYGVISRRSDHRYGALIIFKINEEETEQKVWCTPKLHYPFNKLGEFTWPPINELLAYVKEDGTNILAYHYTYKEKDYTTYKTRLTPVVTDTTFGSFKSMWEEYLQDNPWVQETINANPNFNLSFELYGSRNPITIDYEIPLAVSLLFGVKRTDAVIRPPNQLNLLPASKTPSYEVLDKDNPTEGYQNLRTTAKVFNDCSLETKGSLSDEGMVLYVHTGEPSWIMFKCKPEQIEKIHWSASGFIPKIALWTTLVNAFESNEDPTKEDVRELLLEEYTEQQIAKSIPRIKKLYAEVKHHMEITKTVNNVWVLARKEGLDITQDKGATMRFMSKYFDKNDMRKVGSIVLKQAGLLTGRK